MKIIITEEQKKKLFIPRKQSGEDSKWVQWNKEQPLINGVQINQYDEDGLKQGYWEEYYSNGNINSKGVYVDNDKEGKWVYYFHSGELFIECKYEDNLLNGEFIIYWKNGNINRTGVYQDGMKHGKFNYYNENGVFVDEKIFHYDK